MASLKLISLVHTKARMSLKADASRLYLSYLWWVLEPVLWALAFYFVFTILLGFGRDLLFIMAGKIPFLWFSKSITNGSDSVAGGKSLINQTNIPKQFFPYVATVEVLYRQWVVFLVLMAMAWIYGHTPSLHWLWVIPLMIVQYLVILPAAMFGAILVCYVRDFKILIGMAMIVMMFMSGIFWDLNHIADPVKRELLITWNPLAFLIDGYRNVLMRESLYDFWHLGRLALVSIVAIVLLNVFYRWKSQDMASRVINS